MAEIPITSNNPKEKIESNEENIETEQQDLLNNPSFKRKRDFFSFYSKYKGSTKSSSGNPGHLKKKNLGTDVIIEKPEYKRFSAVEIIPRGFGITKVKERIQFFEKGMLEKQYKINDLSDYNKKYYDNNEPRGFDMSSIKVENIKSSSFNFVAIKKKDDNKDNNISKIKDNNLSNNKDNNISNNINENKDNGVDNNINNNKDNNISNNINENKDNGIDNNINNNKDNNISNNINENKDNGIDNNINNNINENKDNGVDDNIINTEKKRKNESRKSCKNFVVDYSKIINSSKINKTQKELDIFLNAKKKEKSKCPKNNINTYKQDPKPKEKDKEELSKPLYSNKKNENSTNFSPTKISDKLNSKIKHYQQKKITRCYNDILSKIPDKDKINDKFPGSYKVIKVLSLEKKRKEVKNDKYILIKKNNKINIEKKQKFKSVKNILYDNNISDNMDLDRLDRAKFKLYHTNNDKIIKNQIFEIIDKLVFDSNNIKENNKNKKSDRTIEIMPQLLLIKQKLKLLLMNKQNGNILDCNNNLDENDIKIALSSKYFLKCIGLETNIFFDNNKKDQINNQKYINDINQNIQLKGIDDKKKYLKYYFENINKANLFLEILIDNINKQHSNDHILLNK